MGAEFQGATLKQCTISELKGKVEEACDADAYDYGHGGYTGSWAEKKGEGVDVVDKTFPTKDSAKDYVLDNSEKWGPLLAVKYQEDDAPWRWYVGGWCSC